MAVTAAEWKRAVRPALRDPDAWAFGNKLAYRTPVRWILIGVFGEGSASGRNGVYIWSLVMPLYVESEHVVLSHSRRVSPSGVFSPDDEAGFRAAVAAALDALPTEDGALRSLAAGSSDAALGAARLLAGENCHDLAETRERTARAIGVL